MSSIEVANIPRSRHLVRHTKSNRIFMAGDPSNLTALYYSDPNNPKVVEPTSIMYPTTDDGPITGIATFVDAVVIFFRRSVWIWRGIDPDIDAIWQRTPMSIGTNAPHSIKQITHLLTFVNEAGIYGISPSVIGQSADIRLGGEHIINITENKVGSLFKGITNLENVVAEYDAKNRRYMLAYCDNDTKINNKILVFDETIGAFSIWEGIQANDIYCRANGDVLIASKNYILRLGEGFFDIDVDTGRKKPIKFEAKIATSFQAPLTRKLFTKAWVQVGAMESEGAEFSLEISADEDDTLNEVVEVKPEEELYSVYVNRFRKTGKQFSAKITHESLGEEFRLYSVGVDVTPVRSYGKRV